MRNLAMIGVPTSAGAHAPGQERAPEAYRTAGIVERFADRGISVDDRGDLPKVRWTPDRRNPRAQHAEEVAEVAAAVADAVRAATACGSADAVLVLGGDCTIEAGVVSGFTAVDERIGLVYLDAGPDLNVPSAVRLGFLDWMGTAHLLGLLEATYSLSHIGPRFPLLESDQIVFVGAIPEELTQWEQQVVTERRLQMIWVDEVKDNPARAAQQALSSLEDRVDRILVHFDVDVVDFIDFPAADFPTINAGLTLTEAFEVIGQCTRHPNFAALTICEFNPDHVDEDHQLVRTFVEQLVAAFPSS
ncbi:MAG: arginase family protein [Acidimicrobiales bacterium]